jgi:hypothetical protein
LGDSLKKVRLTLAVPKADDPTSYYRAFGPFGELRKAMGNLEFNLPSSYSWATMGTCDGLFLQRPADPQCLQVANTAKLSGTPLWIDFDDDNLAVPESNETHEFFGRWEVKDTIVKCARLADVITVSTEFLKKKYSIYNKNIHVVPNALNERYLHIRNLIPKRPRDKVIVWRGGPGFHDNLAEITPSIIKLAEKNPSWKWIFMGHNPWQITSNIKNKQLIPWLPYIDYLQTICQLHASTFIYCLKANDHSMSRSNIAWLEATLAGSTVLAKDFPEFQKPGCMNFSNAEEFEQKMNDIFQKKIDLEEQYQTSWAHIQENYMLSKANEVRKLIIEKIAGL